MPDDRAHARDRLVRFAREYTDRKSALDREAEALQDERDSVILDAFASGMTTREIARTLGGISHQRVAQIVQKR